MIEHDLYEEEYESAYDVEDLGHVFKALRTGYKAAAVEIQKAKFAIGKAICLYGTAVEAYEDCPFMPYGPEQTVTKEFCISDILRPYETRKLSKVYYHYCYLPNPEAIRFDIDYLCTIHIDCLVRFIPLLLQHYRNAGKGIGSRVRAQKDLIQINTDKRKHKTRWRELGELNGFEVGDLLKVKEHESYTVPACPSSANFHIRPEYALDSCATFAENTDFVVDRLLGDLQCWSNGNIQEPLEDLDDLYCMKLTS